MKTILITGGSKGIGKCVVEEAIKNNYKVVFTYNKSKKAQQNHHTCSCSRLKFFKILQPIILEKKVWNKTKY